MNIGSYQTWYPDSHWSSYPPYSWNYGFPPLPSASPSSFPESPSRFQASPSSYHTSYSGSVPVNAPSPQYLFWVCKLNNRITTCFGCRGKFTRSAGGGVPIPPLDIILKCNESRQYYGKDGNMHEKENANTYYHPNFSCIRNKHPDFTLSEIRVEDGVRTSLLPVHFNLLQSVFNFHW